MMELILRISSDDTEYGDTASKTVLSERRKAPRETCRRRLRGIGTLQRWRLQRRGEGAGVTPRPNPPANGATLRAAIRQLRRVIRRILRHSGGCSQFN